MTETEYVEMEASMIESEDAFFSARPESDLLSNRAMFRAGFTRGYVEGNNKDADDTLKEG